MPDLRIFRFVGRNGKWYYWERPVPNTSMVEEIRCPVAWYWNVSVWPAADFDELLNDN